MRVFRVVLCCAVLFVCVRVYSLVCVCLFGAQPPFVGAYVIEYVCVCWLLCLRILVYVHCFLCVFAFCLLAGLYDSLFFCPANPN